MKGGCRCLVCVGKAVSAARRAWLEKPEHPTPLPNIPASDSRRLVGGSEILTP